MHIPRHRLYILLLHPCCVGSIYILHLVPVIFVISRSHCLHRSKVTTDFLVEFKLSMCTCMMLWLAVYSQYPDPLLYKGQCLVFEIQADLPGRY